MTNLSAVAVNAVEPTGTFYPTITDGLGLETISASGVLSIIYKASVTRGTGAVCKGLISTAFGLVDFVAVTTATIGSQIYTATRASSKKPD